MTVAEAVEAFLAYALLTRSSNTWRSYRSRLRPLASELGTVPLATLTRDQVEMWLLKADRWPEGTPKSGSLKAPDTRRANAIAFGQLQTWAVERGHLAAAVLVKIKKPAGRRREKIPTALETERLLRDASPAFALIYQSLRQSAARPGELCRAQISDWNRGENAIILLDHKTATKSGKPRRIAVGSRLEAMLLQSIAGRADGPIFITPTGRAWTAQRLSTVYRKLRNAAGLPKEMCVYLARHEHASVICPKLGIHATAEALGHASIVTTQRYVKTSDEQRAKNQDAFEG